MEGKGFGGTYGEGGVEGGEGEEERGGLEVDEEEESGVEGGVEGGAWKRKEGGNGAEERMEKEGEGEVEGEA